MNFCLSLQVIALFTVSSTFSFALKHTSLSSSIQIQKKSMSILLNSLNLNIDVSNQQQPLSPDDSSNLPNPLTLSKSLQRLMLQLKGSVMSDDGKKVNYHEMKNSELYQEYKSLSPILSHYKIDDINTSLTEQQRFSFFVNIYNAMIMNAYCDLGPPDNTPVARTMFFSGASGVKYNICGLSFSPDDVEHGILRANTAHPSKQALGETHYFADGDERSKLSMSVLDPRIHFILNCGAVSCPPIAILGDDPEYALQVASFGYLDSEISVNLSNNDSECTLFLPKLLLWYGNDFATDMKERLHKIFQLFKPAKREAIESQLRPFGWPNDIKFTIAYNDYNWTPNSI